MADLSAFTSVFKTNTNNNRVAKRNRRPLSCLQCRDKKQKCDRSQPCSNCTKRGDSANCNYSYVVPQKTPKPRSTNDVAASRLQKLEDMVNGLMHAGPMSNSIITPPDSSASPQVDTSAHTDISAGGHLSRQGTQVNYIGGTHWASILESIQDIRSVIDSGLDDSVPEPAQPPLKADPLFGQEKLLTIDQVISILPERHMVDSLVASYFKESFLSLTFIHSGKFQREYEAFWRDPEASSVSFCWLSILFSIMFMAGKLAVARGQHATSGPCTTAQTGALRTAAKCLVAGRYLTATPYSVEALLFHFHCIYALHADSELQPWPILTMATRLAQKMGYHRDPRHLARLSPFESEMRRRAWFYIEIFDMTMSAHQGIPAMINEDECDCQFPTNLLDEDFDENTAVMPPPRSDTTHIPMLFFTCKAEALRLLRPIVRNALSNRRHDLEETNRLHDKLEQSHQNVPPSLRIRTMANTSFVDQDYLIMQRWMLELQYLKGLCILHRPYLGYKQEDPTYERSREICVNSALRQLDLQTDYFQALQPQGRLYQSRWMFTNVTLHEQFAAAMIICLDLDLNESNSQSVETRARKVNALEKARHIWSSKRPVYQDAVRASHVLDAMISKLTSDSSPPLPIDTLGKPENLQYPPTVTQIPYASQQDVVMFPDSAHNMMDITSLESIFENPDVLNWNDIDTYLIDYSGTFVPAGFDLP